MFKEIALVLLGLVTVFFGYRLYLEYRLNRSLQTKQRAMRLDNAYPVQRVSFLKVLVPATTMALVAVLNTGGVDFEPTLNNVEIAEINNASDLLAIRSEFDDTNSIRYFGGEVSLEVDTETAPQPEAVKESSDILSDGTDDFTETNVQVIGVDEIDNVKTDGSFIYSINYNYETGSNNVVVTQAWPVEDLSVYKTLEFTPNVCADEYCTNEWVNGMYVDGDRLIVVTNRNTYFNYRFYDKGEEEAEVTEDIMMIEPFFGQEETVVYVYDKTDNFELLDTYKFEGWMSGTRRIGDNLFIITNSWFNTEDETLLPQYNVNGETFEADFSDVTYIKDTSPYNFTSIYGIDLNTGDVDVENILGSSSYTLYVSNDNIYTIDHKWYGGGRVGIFAEGTVDEEVYEDTIVISKYKLDGHNVELAAIGEAKGYPLNQFSMDEHNGYFRITTTTGWGEYTNNRLIVMDEGLTIVSELEKLGKPGERLQSTRFMGDVAYLVTFEQTDPFYVVDLENPENPTILGELEITGFSTYIHPIDKNHVMGIGFEADEDGRRTGLKISIYDVTDQTNPIEEHKYVIDYENQGWNWSSVTYNHKDLLFDARKGVIGFPFSSEVYEDNEYKWQSGYLLFSFDVEEGMEQLGYVTHGTSGNWNEWIQKGLFLEEYLYTVANSKIGVSHLDDVENLIGLIKLEVE